MNEKKKPEFEQILNWLEGTLSDQQAMQLEAELGAAGPEYKAEVDWVRDFLAASAISRASTPNPELRTDLIRKFEEYKKQKPAPGWIERLTAVLKFDSNTQFALAGARSVPSVGRQRQLIYDTDIAEIALNIVPNSQDGQLALAGQIYPKGGVSPAGFIVQIVETGENVDYGLTISDELGEFNLESIPQGRYSIFLSADKVEISLPEIQLQR